MSVYPDKKNGQLTGRFRVELQRKAFGNYRARHDTYADAMKDEVASRHLGMLVSLWCPTRTPRTNPRPTPSLP
jgi:hypothetical protein